MAELLPLFNSPIESEESEHGLSHKKTRANRTADFYLKKLDILSGLTYTDGNCGKPIIRTTTIEELPNSMIAFSKAVSSKSFNHIVHFYEADRSFARIMHNPQMYAKYSVASSTSFLQIFHNIWTCRNFCVCKTHGGTVRLVRTGSHWASISSPMYPGLVPTVLIMHSLVFQSMGLWR